MIDSTKHFAYHSLLTQHSSHHSIIFLSKNPYLNFYSLALFPSCFCMFCSPFLLCLPHLHSYWVSVTLITSLTINFLHTFILPLILFPFLWVSQLSVALAQPNIHQCTPMTCLANASPDFVSMKSFGIFANSGPASFIPTVFLELWTFIILSVI